MTTIDATKLQGMSDMNQLKTDFQGNFYPSYTGSNYEYTTPGATNPVTPSTTGLQTPPEWDRASNTYGYYTTGTPVTDQGWYGAHKALAQQNIENAAMQAAEEAGLSGTRWSSPLQRNISDISGQYMTQLGSDYANMQQQSRENAANRAMQAAGGLSGLGQQYFNAPMDWAQSMYGMGTGMTDTYQNALNTQYQDFMRQTPEQSPWTAQAMSYAGLTPYTTPTQYQQSTGSQIMGGLSSLLPLLGLI